jgi:hypothetical protein
VDITAVGREGLDWLIDSQLSGSVVKCFLRDQRYRVFESCVTEEGNALGPKQES